MLNGLDLDFLEISGGSYEQPKMVGLNGLEPAHVETLRPSTRIREAYFLDYAAEVPFCCQNAVNGNWRDAFCCGDEMKP